MSADPTTYGVSTAELHRRRRAYTTLIVSLLCGIAFSSIDYLFSAPAIWSICLGALALCLVLSRLALIPKSDIELQG